MSTDELAQLAAGIADRVARLTGRPAPGPGTDGGSAALFVPSPMHRDSASGPPAASTAADSAADPAPASSQTTPPDAPAGHPGSHPETAPAVHGPRVSVPRTATMTAGRPGTQDHLDDLVRRFTARTPGSKDLAAQHRPILADSRATVGFRSSTKEMLYPLAARSAQGARLTDIDGNEYVDITMGFGTLLFGHEPEWLTDAVRSHLDDGLRIGPRGPETGEAAALLAGLTGMERVAFATSGTEANTSAIRLARAATGRSKIVTFHGAYHGHADATLGRSTGKGSDRRTVPVSPGVPDAAIRDLIVLDYGAPESLQAIEEHAGDIALVLVEPVQSRNPARQPAQFVRELRDLTRRLGIVLLFDEMLTGLRPHPRGAQELYGVTPDLATYGKLLGGGFPIGAIAGRADLLDGVDGGPWQYGDDSYPERDTTFFGGTYLQHPLSMVAARAVLTRLTEEGPDLQGRLNTRTQQLADTLNGFFEEEEYPLRLAHYGSMFRFEHRANMELLYHHLVLRGVYVWEWRNFFLSTAHTDADIDHLTNAVTGALDELRNAGFFPQRTTAHRPSARSQPAHDAPQRNTTPDLSLYFFGDYPEDTQVTESYETLMRAARHADEQGYHAVWLPERHFHSFGGIFPNPSVLAAALARETTTVRINAGSVVLPLHDPVRVAEEWSVVDNLSGGRAGIGCASGWNARDFVLRPDGYIDRRDLMYEQLDQVRALWRGEGLQRTGGDGPEEVRLFPRPMQPDVPMYAAVVGSPESYRRAARHDVGVVTNLMAQTPEQLAENIAEYRRTRAAHGLDPDAGRVVVLLHTYLAADHDVARRAAYEPLLRYMRSSLGLFGQVTGSLGRRVAVESLSEDDLEAVFSRAYDRYCDQRSLIGSPDSVLPVIDRIRQAGADEIAALVDFGVPSELLLASLPHLDTVRSRLHAGLNTSDDAALPATATAATGTSSISATSPSAPGEAAAADARPPQQDAAPAPIPASESPAPEPDMAAVPTPGPAATDPDPTGDPTAPLSPGQQRIWAHQHIVPGDTSYHEPAAIGLDGPLDIPALQNALSALVQRHEMLRTVFPTVAGEPRQRVLPAGPAGPGAVEQLAATDRSGTDENHAIREAMQAEGSLPFDLATGPLFRARLLRITPQRHVLVLCFHHIVVDAVSAGILSRDLSALYRAALHGATAELPELTTTYRAFAERQRAAAERTATDLAHWRHALAGELPVLQLPTDRPRPEVMTTRGAFIERHLDLELSARLRKTSRHHRVTPFMTLLAAYAVLLHSVTGEEDIIIGTPVSDRPDGTDHLVGFFINTVALRLDLSNNPGFDTLLRRVRGTSLDAYDHAATPFDTVVQDLDPPRNTTRPPVFQVAAEYESSAPFPLDLPDVTAETLTSGADRALVDLTVYFTGGADGFSCRLEYNADLFDAATIEGFFRRLDQVLRAAVDDPGAPLSSFTEARPTIEGPHHPVPDTTVQELVARQAASTPHRTAVTAADRSLTYRELTVAARCLTQLLADGAQQDMAASRVGDDPRTRTGEGPVALWLPRSTEFVVAALAVLSTGQAYLPLDPGLGPQRVPQLLAASGVRTVLTCGSAPAVPELPPGVNVIRMPSADSLASGAHEAVDDGGEWLARTDPDALSCVLYTSGTEGRPKGVALTHRGLVNLCQWQHRRFGTGPDTRTAAVCSQSFDASLLEIWPALTAGASVAIADEDVRRDPRALSRWYARQGVTFSVLPTALGTQLLALPPEAQPPLRQLLCGGEELTRRPHPHAPYETVNVYGPTETTVLATEQRVAPRDGADTVGPVAIGRPLDNVQVYLLDDRGTPVPPGTPGELHIGGLGVAHGYHRDPDRTAERFRPDPNRPSGRIYRTGDLASLGSDGALLFHGRRDEQVKIRGYRVEPAEAAQVLLELAEVHDGAVVVQQDARGDNRLAGYVVPAGDPTDRPAFLAGVRARIAERLPDYLVPVVWSVVAELPLTVNGKIDSAALPTANVPPTADCPAGEPSEPADRRATAPPGAEPLSGEQVPDAGAPALISRLRCLWAEELGTEPQLVTDEDSFFSLGGDSIKAIRLVNRVSEEFTREYPVVTFFQEPTLSAMAGRVAQPPAARVQGEV